MDGRIGVNMGPMKRRNKYNAIKTKVGDVTCDSKREAFHYGNLLIAEKSGHIKELRVHPRYPIEVLGIKICNVVLDFEFFDTLDNKTHFIDVKGFYNSESRLRHKLFNAVYGEKVEIWK